MSRDVASLWRDIQLRDAVVKAYDDMADDLAQLGEEMLQVGAKDIAEQCMDSAMIARRASRSEHINRKPEGLP